MLLEFKHHYNLIKVALWKAYISCYIIDIIYFSQTLLDSTISPDDVYTYPRLLLPRVVHLSNRKRGGILIDSIKLNGGAILIHYKMLYLKGNLLTLALDPPTRNCLFQSKN